MSEIWYCKIGQAPPLVLDGADAPLRDAVARAFAEVTDVKPDFIFSGWGAELTEDEQAVVDREPS